MKIQEEERTILKSGNFQDNAFTIKASAKAFQILSKNLYTDIPLAIVRELSCNAYDSQVEAGQEDKPFLVHLPNKLEPFFQIRDYGTGLSHEQAMTLYTTYFDSTRSGSDNYVGCWGLGSKSPYSYTDSFTVISFQEGMQRTYSLYINEEGFPHIALLDESSTKEPNGLQITISVTEKDFSSFYTAAYRVYKFFKVWPTINQIEKQNWYETLWSGEGWKVIEPSDYTSRRDKSYAVMGNIGYPLGNVSSDGTYINDSLEWFYNNNTHLLLDFNIGELEVSTNKEELHLSERTLKSLSEKLKTIQQEMKTIAQKGMKEAKTLWEARCLEKSISRNIREIIDIKLEFNGQPIENIKDISSKLYMLGEKVRSASITPLKKAIVFDAADFQNPRQRIIRFLEENKDKYTHAYVFHPSNTEETADQIWERLGIPLDQRRKVTDLAKPVRGPRQKTSLTSSANQIFDITKHERMPYRKIDFDLNPSEKIVYLIKEGTKFNYNTYHNIRQGIKILKEEGGDNIQKIIGISERIFNKFREKMGPNYISVFELNEKVREVVGKKVQTEAYKNDKIRQSLKNYLGGETYNIFLRALELMEKENKLSEQLKEYIKYHRTDNLPDLGSFSNWVDTNEDFAKPIIENLDKTYPLLSMLYLRYWAKPSPESIKHLAFYLEMVEKEKENEELHSK